ncbi:MAG: hypothetical protein WAK03_13630 [Methylocystis sp.]
MSVRHNYIVVTTFAIAFWSFSITSQASASGNRTPFHIDASAPGAPGKTPQTYGSPLVVNFQLRPATLAH